MSSNVFPNAMAHARKQSGLLLNPFRFGSGGGGGGDPHFSEVVMLLHMDGTNGSTTFTDNSSYGRTFTAFNSAQISTTQSKFGGASGSFLSDTSYITTPDAAEFSLGTSDFTIEFFIYFTALPTATDGICGHLSTSSYANTSFAITRVPSPNRIQAYCASGSTQIGLVIAGSNSIILNTWHHVAYVRNGNNFRLYFDGVGGPTVSSSASLNDTTGSFSIGRRGDDSFFRLKHGYVDEFRMTVGTARYTDNFTPPTEAFPDS